MKKETAYYGMAIFIHSLITKEKVAKKEMKSELIRIIDEMYKTFN